MQIKKTRLLATSKETNLQNISNKLRKEKIILEYYVNIM